MTTELRIAITFHSNALFLQFLQLQNSSNSSSPGSKQIDNLVKSESKFAIYWKFFSVNSFHCLLWIRNRLVEEVKISPFSIATDGSNDNGLLKMNPLTTAFPPVEQPRSCSQPLIVAWLHTTFRGKTVLPLASTRPMSTWARPTQLWRALIIIL